MCLAVVLDTFVMCTVFVPSVASLLLEVNWWPSKLKTIQIGDSDADERTPLKESDESALSTDPDGSVNHTYT